MRINQFLARCGFGSRRKCEELVREGKVSLNGTLLTELGEKVDPKTDHVSVEGKPALLFEEQAETWLFHKPKGCLCTRNDPENRPTVFDFLPQLPPPYQCVGRLDQDSEGLLLITRNGLLAEKLMHPRYEIEKIYEVTIRGIWRDDFIQRLKDGVRMEEGGIGTAEVIHYQALSDTTHTLKLRLTQGKKREIRYSLRALGLTVERLIRRSLGPLSLGKLPPKRSRELSAAEEELILNISAAQG